MIELGTMAAEQILKLDYNSLSELSHHRKDYAALMWLQRSTNQTPKELVDEIKTATNGNGVYNLTSLAGEGYSFSTKDVLWAPKYLGDLNGQLRIQVHELNSFPGNNLGAVALLAGLSKAWVDDAGNYHVPYPRPVRIGATQLMARDVLEETIRLDDEKVDPANSYVFIFTENQMKDMSRVLVAAGL